MTSHHLGFSTRSLTSSPSQARTSRTSEARTSDSVWRPLILTEVDSSVFFCFIFIYLFLFKKFYFLLFKFKFIIFYIIIFYSVFILFIYAYCIVQDAGGAVAVDDLRVASHQTLAPTPEVRGRCSRARASVQLAGDRTAATRTYTHMHPGGRQRGGSDGWPDVRSWVRYPTSTSASTTSKARTDQVKAVNTKT